ncbi:innexin [Plakobranchus ocellatus]|uniref:Innexin n=1 Tax=Plakobranchus ocellatus TaxID=259542 RepID=A0AAV3ZZK1_9GAST|nr:innexin [Plakobranchus ocellatus]
MWSNTFRINFLASGLEAKEPSRGQCDLTVQCQFNWPVSDQSTVSDRTWCQRRYYTMASPAGVATALAAIGSLSRDESVHDDDAVARLNHWAAYSIVMILALAAGTKQYVGEPVSCWAPAQFYEKWYKRYVNNYCWVHPLYKVPFTESIPVQEKERWETLTGFYRWVVVCFILQAFLFRLPRFFWQMAKSQSGINIEKIVTMTMDTALSDSESRNEKLGHVAEFMHRWATTRRRPLQ